MLRALLQDTVFVVKESVTALSVVGREFVLLTISGVTAIWIAALLHLDQKRRAKKRSKHKVGQYTKDLFD